MSTHALSALCFLNVVRTLQHHVPAHAPAGRAAVAVAFPFPILFDFIWIVDCILLTKLEVLRHGITSQVYSLIVHEIGDRAGLFIHKKRVRK